MSLSLRVVTWNVLADSYVHGQSLLDPNDYQHRVWPVRSEMIRNCLTEMDADVCCLQEVDYFEKFYRSAMKEMGYKALYVKRPTKHDGCLVAFKSDRFQLVEHRQVNLDDLSFIDGDRKSSRSKFFKNNVALFVVLKDTASDRLFMVANCHIHWNPALEDVKCAQVAYLLEQLAEFRGDYGGHVPILWAGDFNSMPHSDVYRILTASVAQRHTLLHALSPVHIARQIALQDSNSMSSNNSAAAISHNPYYGANTRFLCDPSLNKVCRWLRMLGIQVACESWDTPPAAVTATLPANATGKSNKAMKASNINAFFDIATSQQRVLLTTSKGLLERNTCPRHSRYVDPAKQAQELIALFQEYGLPLTRDKFLTVCGKCGGVIEVARADDPRMMGKVMPNDREVYACVNCAQPYWWNDEENSSPARAIRKAEELYQMISQALHLPPEPSRPAILVHQTTTATTTTAATSPKTTTAAAAATIDNDTVEKSETLSVVSISSAGERKIVVKRQDISILNALRGESTSSTSPDAQEEETEKGVVGEVGVAEMTDGLQSLTLVGSETAAAVSSTNTITNTINNTNNTAEEEAFPDLVEEEPVLLSEEFRIASEIMRAKSVGALPQLVSVFTTTTTNTNNTTTTNNNNNNNNTNSNSNSSNNVDNSAAECDDEKSSSSNHNEPATTNWAGEFVGTLDYILHTAGEWRVHWARVCPVVSLNDGHPTCNLSLPPANNNNNSNNNSSSNNNNSDNNSNDNTSTTTFVQKYITHAQPTQQWPSDHFAIVTEVSLVTDTR